LRMPPDTVLGLCLLSMLRMVRLFIRKSHAS
jgi:hypothetical protein